MQLKVHRKNKLKKKRIELKKKKKSRYNVTNITTENQILIINIL